MSATKLNLKQLAQSRQRKIDSPLAKYNSAGQLFCVLCNTQVKNEIYWTGHINGRGHKDNLSALKEKKASGSTSGHVFKRPAPVDEGGSGSVVSNQPPNKVIKIEDEKEASVKEAEEELKRMMKGEKRLGGNVKEEEVSVEEEQEVEEKRVQASSLPAGFFDDPKEDAKARGMKFRDPQDVEWDKFVKEIASEDVKSNEIVGEEQEKSAVDRDLDHIEEQMAQWQRVIDLEKRAAQYAELKKTKPPQNNSSDSNVMDIDNNTNENDDEDEDADYDEELDWRNKKR